MTVILPNGDKSHFVCHSDCPKVSQLGPISRDNLLLTAELPWKPENTEQSQLREFQVGIPHPQGEAWSRDVGRGREQESPILLGCRVRLAEGWAKEGNS